MVQLELLETLPERVANHAKLFDGMLQLIPAKYYISQKKPQNENSKYMVNKRKNAPKQEIKEATKKAKKAKLDPENVKSIAEVQKEELEKAKVAEDHDASDDDDDSNEEETVGGDFSGLGSVKSETSSVDTAQTETSDNFQPMLRSDIAELHTRLQKRIAEMRRKRNAPNSDSPKARSREEMLQERRKRREEKKKALKAQKEKGNKAPSEALINTKPEQSKQEEKSAADSIKMDGDLFFGKINVGEQKKKKKGPTDAKSALKKVEEKQAELEKLRQEDEEMVDAMVEESHWGKAVLMATGEKVKDDPKLLKKTIKKTEAQKRRSAKEWKLRMEKVKQDEIKRQKKREENIQKRKEEKKGGNKNKKKKARPGFEGAQRGAKSKKK